MEGAITPQLAYRFVQQFDHSLKKVFAHEAQKSRPQNIEFEARSIGGYRIIDNKWKVLLRDVVVWKLFTFRQIDAFLVSHGLPEKFSSAKNSDDYCVSIAVESCSRLLLKCHNPFHPTSRCLVQTIDININPYIEFYTVPTDRRAGELTCEKHHRPKKDTNKAGGNRYDPKAEARAIKMKAYEEDTGYWRTGKQRYPKKRANLDGGVPVKKQNNSGIKISRSLHLRSTVPVKK